MKNSILTLTLCVLSLSSFAQVSITFEVNLSHQIKEGNFDRNTETVDIAGTFNGWGSTLNQLQDPDADSIYTATISGFTAGSSIEFKFRFNAAWDGREEFPGGGSNRSHTVGASNETISFWYNDEEPPTGPAIAGVSASSTFTFVGGNILFSEDADGLVENYEWTFEGGTPSTSTSSSVSVSYDTPGTYDVTLRVSNSFSEDEMVLTDFIEVGEKSTNDLEWWNEATFYEIFVRSFYDSDGDGIGDFQGIVEKLDYLNDGDPNTTSDLGITGIWLMPIHDSPSYHGYDVTDYRSINPDYGTMEDFKFFVEEAHKRGIKVIIDLVLNHSSTQIDWFQDAASSTSSDKRNWYRWTISQPNYSGPWGQTVWHGSNNGYYYGLFWGGMPDLNYEEPEVVAEMNDITRFWLEDVGIDGYRLDAVKYIKEDGSDLEDLASTHAFWRDWVAVTKESNPDALSVGEAWTSTEKIVPYVVNEGLDFCFDFDLGSAIINGVKSQSATGMASQISKVINSYPYYQFGTFTTNHDMNRLMDELSNDEDRVKLAAAIYLTLPGVPFVYYGEEIGMTGRKPDENIRRPMAWSDEENAGFSSQNPWNQPSSNYETNNVASEQKDGSSLFQWYRKLIQLRSSTAALQTGDYELISSSSSVLAFKRSTDEDQLYTLVNLSGSSQELVLDIGDLIKVGAEPALVNVMGTERIDVLNKNEVTVSIPSETAMVLTMGNLTLGSTEKVEHLVYPNPFADEIRIQSIDKVSYRIIDLEGKLIQEGAIIGTDSINTQALKKGVYFLEIQIAKRRIVKKIFKK
ncbi:alpha-amylase family glycosyl hydrolase [Ekhidna sp.]